MGEIVVLKGTDDIRAFVRMHQLVQQDVEEMLDMQALASSRPGSELMLHYQAPSA